MKENKHKSFSFILVLVLLRNRSLNNRCRIVRKKRITEIYVCQEHTTAAESSELNGVEGILFSVTSEEEFLVIFVVVFMILSLGGLNLIYTNIP